MYKFILIFFCFFYSNFVFSENNNISSGSGFYIDNNGHIITAYHVIRGRDDIWINNSINKKLIHASLIKYDLLLDLALLKVSSSGPPLKLANWENNKTIPVGIEVCAVGYPTLGYKGTSLRITQGIVNSSEGINGEPRMFQVSAGIEKGNSGGPIIAPDGSVIGVVLSKLNALYIAEKTKDLPQNVNFAIKSSSIIQFLNDQEQIKPLLVNFESKSNLRPYQILNASEPSIVRIISINKDEVAKRPNLFSN
jgi:S1-C subfamily serine protease